MRRWQRRATDRYRPKGRSTQPCREKPCSRLGLVVSLGCVGVAGAVLPGGNFLDFVPFVIHGFAVNDLSLQFHLTMVGKRNRHGWSKDAVFEDRVKSFHGESRIWEGAAPPWNYSRLPATSRSEERRVGKEG